MASHMSSMGFRFSTNEEFVDLAMTAATQGEPIQVGDGTYYRWSPGAGVELWAQVDEDGQIIGLNPHFSGAARMRVRLIERVARADDSPLDGAFYGWADPAEEDREEDDPEDGQYPFAFDAPDIRRHDALALPSIVNVQLAAFAQEVRAFESDEAFQAGESFKMAARVVHSQRHVLRSTRVHGDLQWPCAGDGAGDQSAHAADVLAGEGAHARRRV